jgi:hypothetical protein
MYRISPIYHRHVKVDERWSISMHKESKDPEDDCLYEAFTEEKTSREHVKVDETDVFPLKTILQEEEVVSVRFRSNEWPYLCVEFFKHGPTVADVLAPFYVTIIYKQTLNNKPVYLEFMFYENLFLFPKQPDCWSTNKQDLWTHHVQPNLNEAAVSAMFWYVVMETRLYKNLETSAIRRVWVNRHKTQVCRRAQTVLAQLNMASVLVELICFEYL